jgi:hypothetical protein
MAVATVRRGLTMKATTMIRSRRRTTRPRQRRRQQSRRR